MTGETGADRNQQLSTSARLNELYKIIEGQKMIFESDREKRRQFFRKMQGEFVQVYCEKEKVSHFDLAQFLDIPVEMLDKFIQGQAALSDFLFFKICHRLGADAEVLIFINKLGNGSKF